MLDDGDLKLKTSYLGDSDIEGISTHFNRSKVQVSGRHFVLSFIERGIFFAQRFAKSESHRTDSRGKGSRVDHGLGGLSKRIHAGVPGAKVRLVRLRLQVPGRFSLLLPSLRLSSPD